MLCSFYIQKSKNPYKSLHLLTILDKRDEFPERFGGPELSTNFVNCIWYIYIPMLKLNNFGNFVLRYE